MARVSPAIKGANSTTLSTGSAAERIARTPAQVLLRWCIQRQAIVCLRSPAIGSGSKRMAGWVFDVELADGDIAQLDALDRTGGTDKARERKWW
jgi:diketogulonate reductase-like aldo/keto reductase